MKNKVILSIILVIVFILGFFLGGFLKEDKNLRLMYDDTGFPKNCRATVKLNYEGFKSKMYTAEGALGSIDQYCGEYGSLW